MSSVFQTKHGDRWLIRDDDGETPQLVCMATEAGNTEAGKSRDHLVVGRFVFPPDMWRYTPMPYRHEPVGYQTVILKDGTVLAVYFVKNQCSDDFGSHDLVFWIVLGKPTKFEWAISWDGFVDHVGNENIQSIVPESES